MSGVSGPRGAGRGRIVPLPSAARIARDIDRMIAFGPRLPGHPNHARFVDWLEEEFAAAGLQILPGEFHPYRRWDAHAFGLDVEGAAGAIGRHACYVRSRPTGPDGVTGPLTYGGGINAAGPARLAGIPAGSIVVFDASLPPVTLSSLSGGIETPYVHLPDESRDAYLRRPYRRLWLTPDFPLDAVAARGAAGAVIIMDVSSDMLRGNFSPHHSACQPPLPALFAGREEGELLRERAQAGAQARLTLDAEWVECTVRSVTACLAGASDEVIVVDTHTDGQNGIQENGCLALLQLARHFASLPEGRRLRRSLVFAGWPGHMAGNLPELRGWMAAHPHILARTAAAVTIEHLGATEWDDVPERGYVPTGRSEYMNMATTRGVLMDLVMDGIRRHDLRHHGVQPGPGMTVGAAFHRAGIPHMGCVAGPAYLLGVVENGHRDKLDARLAERQTAMLAELIRAIDGVSAARLRADDPSLGVDCAWKLSLT